MSISTPAEQEFIDQVIARCAGKPGALLSILEQVQDRNPQKYLPAATLEYIAMRTAIPQARLFSVVSFYALFNQQPQGQNTVCICRGTACHTHGSRSLLHRLQLELGLKGGEDDSTADKLSLTTPDGKFTLRTVACFGQCALAPVVEVNHSIHGHVNEQSLQRAVNSLK